MELTAENTNLYKIRHSLAHVLAQAVKELFPEAKLGFGPPTDTGFFYDFDFGDTQLHESQLKDIEKRMKKIIGKRQEFLRSDTDFDGAISKIESVHENYKQENIENLKSRGVKDFSFYQNGEFLDLCEGPHVAHTGELPAKAFKLDRVAGAYWLGDENNKMLTRIYALCFETSEELADFIKRRKAAEEFDHKKLGKELGIFHIDDTIGKGLPLWLPNGAIVRDSIEDFAKELEFRYGYKRVSTPHITHESLYQRSGHLDSYKDSMFPPMVCKHDDTGTEERYYLKPMNCPHHHMIYLSSKRSYRELPLRLAEYGTQYRYEQSGELSGLIRVRCMTLNDAHIYCRLDQVADEIKRTFQLYKEFYDTFKLKDYKFRLSVRDKEDNDKFKGDNAMWEKAEKILQGVLDELELPYYVGEGEAAFYGPKVDVQFKNLMGREETVSTIQVDFLSPLNFEMKYIDETGGESDPVIIHRAPLSTHERFISFVMEYYGGAFPTWCAPTQVCLIPVNETCNDYAAELAQTLHNNFIRSEVDDSSNSFGKKIRTNTMRKIPILLIIGNKEVDDRTVTIRRYGQKEQDTVSQDEFISRTLDEIKTRRNDREPMGSII